MIRHFVLVLMIAAACQAGAFPFCAPASPLICSVIGPSATPLRPFSTSVAVCDASRGARV